MSDKPLPVHARTVIEDIRSIARDYGYGIGEHGSMRPERDIDLIAVPWVKEAKAARTLMRAINQLPYLRRVKEHDHDPPKPHGRKGFVWTIDHRHADCPRYVDLSVMPRHQDAT